jgi:hypothetical protein
MRQVTSAAVIFGSSKNTLYSIVVILLPSYLIILAIFVETKTQELLECIGLNGA